MWPNSLGVMCIIMYILKQVSHKYDKCCSKNRINLCKQTALATNNNDDKMHPIWYSQLKTHNYNNKTKESEREGGSKNARSKVTAISYFVFVFVFVLLLILYFVMLLCFCLLLFFGFLFLARCCGAHSQLIFAQPKAKCTSILHV